MRFEIVGPLSEIEVIAEGPSVRPHRQLRRRYGGLRRRKLKGIASKTRKRFAICIENRACDDLEVGKVYRPLSDRLAAAKSYLRVVDDSGEDYLYPASYFVFVELPSRAERARAAARRRAASRTA